MPYFYFHQRLIKIWHLMKKHGKNILLDQVNAHSIHLHSLLMLLHVTVLEPDIHGAHTKLFKNSENILNYVCNVCVCVTYIYIYTHTHILYIIYTYICV
jgi:hypothetical protein